MSEELGYNEHPDNEMILQAEWGQARRAAGTEDGHLMLAEEWTRAFLSVSHECRVWIAGLAIDDAARAHHCRVADHERLLEERNRMAVRCAELTGENARLLELITGEAVVDNPEKG